jgi:hypothetical protein
MLISCYTQEQLDETKMGQLEMTKKVFTDIMQDPADSSGHKESHWKYDVGECSAFSSLKNNADSVKSVDLMTINLIAFLVSYFLQ